MRDDFEDFIVEAEERDRDKHDAHVDDEGAEAREAEVDKLLELAAAFVGFEDVFAVGKEGEKHAGDPGNDVCNLQLERIVRVEHGESERVVDAQAKHGRKKTEDEVHDYLFVLFVESDAHLPDGFVLFSDSHLL